MDEAASGGDFPRPSELEASAEGVRPERSADSLVPLPILAVGDVTRAAEPSEPAPAPRLASSEPPSVPPSSAPGRPPDSHRSQAAAHALPKPQAIVEEERSIVIAESERLDAEGEARSAATALRELSGGWWWEHRLALGLGLVAVVLFAVVAVRVSGPSRETPGPMLAPAARDDETRRDPPPRPAAAVEERVAVDDTALAGEGAPAPSDTEGGSTEVDGEAPAAAEIPEPPRPAKAASAPRSATAAPRPPTTVAAPNPGPQRGVALPRAPAPAPGSPIERKAPF